MKNETIKEVFSWVKVILLAIIAAVSINTFVIVHAHVPTGSMIPTILEESRIVAFRLSYLFSEPDRYDVVVFPYPDDKSVNYVKRIIGKPGETVDIIDGKVYINGDDVPLDDEFVNGTPVGDGHYEVPDGYYFMMGDNRILSNDSRRWDNTYLERSEIMGKVIFTYYPELKLIK